MLGSAWDFDRIVEEVFKPIYKVIVEQALRRSGVSKPRVCLDLGSGTAAIARELARILEEPLIVCLDKSPEMTSVAKYRVYLEKLDSRIELVVGVAEKMPFRSNCIDLIVSRGSIFFWDDIEGGLRESYRVLRRNGACYVGGGFGSKELRETVLRRLSRIKPEAEKHIRDRERMFSLLEGMFREFSLKTNCCFKKIFRDESGFWMLFKKM